jgi:hypothetical protein
MIEKRIITSQERRRKKATRVNGTSRINVFSIEMLNERSQAVGVYAPSDTAVDALDPAQHRGPSHAPIDWLPDEIVLRICGFLSPCEWVALRMTCRRMWHLCGDPSLWRPYVGWVLRASEWTGKWQNRGLRVRIFEDLLPAAAAAPRRGARAAGAQERGAPQTSGPEEWIARWVRTRAAVPRNVPQRLCAELGFAPGGARRCRMGPGSGQSRAAPKQHDRGTASIIPVICVEYWRRIRELEELVAKMADFVPAFRFAGRGVHAQCTRSVRMLARCVRATRKRLDCLEASGVVSVRLLKRRRRYGERHLRTLRERLAAIAAGAGAPDTGMRWPPVRFARSRVGRTTESAESAVRGR